MNGAMIFMICYILSLLTAIFSYYLYILNKAAHAIKCRESRTMNYLTQADINLIPEVKEEKVGWFGCIQSRDFMQHHNYAQGLIHSKMNEDFKIEFSVLL